MSTVESISAVMCWFASEEAVVFHDSEEIFVILSGKASQLYKEGAESLFDIMLRCCIKNLQGYNHKCVQSCIAFFEETQTLEHAVLAAAEHLADDIRYISDILNAIKTKTLINPKVLAK